MTSTSTKRLTPEAQARFECHRAAAAAQDVIAASHIVMEKARHTLARANVVIARSEVTLSRGRPQ